MGVAVGDLYRRRYQAREFGRGVVRRDPTALAAKQGWHFLGFDDFACSTSFANARSSERLVDEFRPPREELSFTADAFTP